MTRNRMIFPNLPVHDLQRSMEFFSRLGFEYNPKFTDQNAACMKINEQAFVMLLAAPFFKTFTKREVVDARTHVEALLCLSCESRAEVDDLVARAIDAGATEPRPAQDHGFMYGRTIADLDGHEWELMWMDPSVAG